MLMTTDPGAALEFRERHGKVIYKSISGIRSVVSSLGPEHLERLDDLAWCPTMLQEYVPGRDFRVHVVGAETFACEIICDAYDYRYAGRQGANVEIKACALGGDVLQKCKTLAAALSLPLAGLDLRCTPDGVWFCFEVNPSPGFTFYQSETGQPIAEAIARLLATAYPPAEKMPPLGVPAFTSSRACL